MAKKMDIEKSLLRSSNNSEWMTKTQLCAYFGCNRNASSIAMAVKGLPRIGKKYMVKDLAENIYAMQECS